MKTGIVTIVVVAITCPDCGESIWANDGSEMFEARDYDLMATVLTCSTCGLRFRRPSIANFSRHEARIERRKEATVDRH